MIVEPVLVRARLPVLAGREQGERALAVRGRGRDRGSAVPRSASRRLMRAREISWRNGVAVHLHELGDLVVGEILELAQHEHLALARRKLRVRIADLVLARGEEDVALGVVVGSPGSKPVPPPPTPPPTGTAPSAMSSFGSARLRRSIRS